MADRWVRAAAASASGADAKAAVQRARDRVAAALGTLLEATAGASSAEGEQVEKVLTEREAVAALLDWVRGARQQEAATSDAPVALPGELREPGVLLPVGSCREVLQAVDTLCAERAVLASTVVELLEAYAAA